MAEVVSNMLDEVNTDTWETLRTVFHELVYITITTTIIIS